MFERISIVGASGVVGRALTRASHSDGWRCRSVSRGPSRALDAISVERAYADLHDPEATRDALTGSNVVIFAASPHQSDPVKYARETVACLRNVLDALANLQIGRIVVPSSVSPFWPEGESVDPTHRHIADGSRPFVDAAYFAHSECVMRAQAGLDVSIVLSHLLVDCGNSPRVSRTVDSAANLRVTPIEALSRAVLSQARSTRRGVDFVFADSEVRPVSKTSLGAQPSTSSVGKSLRNYVLSGPLRVKTPARDDDLVRAV